LSYEGLLRLLIYLSRSGSSRVKDDLWRNRNDSWITFVALYLHPGGQKGLHNFRVGQQVTGNLGRAELRRSAGQRQRQ